METIPMKIIARLYCDFSEKFGIPRQSGMADKIGGRIVFEPEYRNTDALRGLEGYSHIWLLWQFSEAVREDWSPTVRPPKLGGNKRMGVFATRSPFRPNSIGLSSVKLERIELSTPEGPILYVSGADMMNGSPIFDIKPYLPYTDCHSDASGGFTGLADDELLTVAFPWELEERVPENKREALKTVLALDPRPGYQKNGERVYKMGFGENDIHFTVNGKTLTVTNVVGRKE